VAGFHYVSPGYFDALSVGLLPGGRDFTDHDVDRNLDVAIVSERLAGRLFPGAVPVGRHISLASLNGSQPPLTVVGVVRDVRHQTLEGDETAEIYLPHTGGFIGPPLNVIVRGSLPFEQLVPALREAVRRVNPDLPIGEIIPLRERVWRAVALPRFFAVVFGIFAVAAGAIAAAGIYGSMSYAAARRRREVGVRVALGARPGQVVRMMLRQAAILSAIGIFVGIALALPMSRLVGGFLFGVEPLDPLTLVWGAAALATVQMLAGWGPARRSARDSILETLRD
jgi:hypothetical protein